MAFSYVKFMRGTPDAYKASTKDNDTIYFVAEKNAKTGQLYLGETLLAGDADQDHIISRLNDLLYVDTKGAKHNQVLGYDSAEEAWRPMSIESAFQVSVMTGATSSSNGAQGLVPAPTAGQEDCFLRGDGTWAQIDVSVDLSDCATKDDLKNLQERVDDIETQIQEDVDADTKYNLSYDKKSISYIDDATGSIQTVDYTTTIDLCEDGTEVATSAPVLTAHKIIVDGKETIITNGGTLGSFYSANSIDNRFKAVDAMEFMGVVNSDIELPTSSAKIGATYKVGTDRDYLGISCAIGDLLIANGVEDETGYIAEGTLYWEHVASGINTNTTYELNAPKSIEGGVSIELNSSDNTTSKIDIISNTLSCFSADGRVQIESNRGIIKIEDRFSGEQMKFTNERIKSNYMVQVELGDTTFEELAAAAKAGLVTETAEGKVIIRATGTAPEITIPIILYVREEEIK